MDEFLYILFLVGWLAFTVYQQSQKKKRKEAARKIAMQEEETLEQDFDHQPLGGEPVEQPGVKAKSNTNFKSVLEEILLGEQISLETIPENEAQSLETIPANEYVDESEMPSNESRKKEDLSSRSEIENQSPESIQRMKDDLEKDMVLEEDTTEDESTAHYFNLRNAVIYAEILKPKYVN